MHFLICGSHRLHWYWVLLLLVLIANVHNPYANAASRETLSLNGTWDFQWDNERRLAWPPNAEGWTTAEVGKVDRGGLGFGRDGTNHWGWYRRNVRVPDSMRGQRIVLRFIMVKYQTYVYWNGRKVGEFRDGTIPYEIDITEHVRFDRENELVVGVIDRISIQRPDLLPYVDSDFRGEQSSRPVSPPYGALLHAAYSTESFFGGIHDDVELVSYPPVHIDDWHVTTSVRRSELMLDVTSANAGTSGGPFRVEAQIEENGAVIKSLTPASVQLPAGGTVAVRFNERWENPHLWSHEDPYLYTLVIRLYKGTSQVDEIRKKIGFREYWIEGINFYLNGKVLKIRRSPFSYGALTIDDARQYFQELKKSHINQVRLHARGWPSWIADAADEAGMLLVVESAYWSRARWYDVENPVMWENAKTHWAGLVRGFKNHPSVVMYSIENEMQSTGRYMMAEDPQLWRRYQDHWIEVGQFVRTLDPTKPLQYSWGHDVGGWCEVASLHYVRDIKYYFQYPNDLYWLDGENLTRRVRDYDYVWNRDRPLIKGEYEYVYHCNPPHGLTPFIGDQAYVGDNWAKTWYWCVKHKYDAYRYAGITANPWVGDRGKIYNLHDVFLKDWRRNYYGGEVLRKDVIALNEDYFPVTSLLETAVIAGDRTLGQQQDSLPLREGDRQVRPVTFDLPDVSERTDAQLRLRLVQDGKTLAEQSYPVHVFPRAAVVSYDPKTIALYDPDGKTNRELTAGGCVIRRIPEINTASIAGLRVLVLGKDAVTGRFWDAGPVLNAFVEAGGRVIVLEQSLVERHDWLPYTIQIDRSGPVTTGRPQRSNDELTLREYTERGVSATIAFPMMPDHPILNGIEEDDLRYWRGTHQVAKNCYIRPKFWNYTTVAYVGSGNGIEHTPLVTLQHGQGLYTLCQFIISEEMSKEPAASLLFHNMMQYAQSYAPNVAKAAVLAGVNSPVYKTLVKFGAVADRLDGIPAGGLKGYQVLFIDPGIDLSPHRQALDEFLQAGGTVVLRELTPERLANAAAILPGGVQLHPVPEPVSNEGVRTDDRLCPVRAVRTSYDPLTAGITNYDLYWRTPSEYRGIFGEEIAPIAAYYVSGANVRALAEPAILAKIPAGNGTILIDQIDWETGLTKVTDNTCRLIMNELNNLHVQMRPIVFPEHHGR